MARKNDSRFLQANREALFALAAYALYFLWWYLTAYGLGSDSPDNYSYTLGMRTGSSTAVCWVTL